MTSPRMERRQAAILAADVASYSRLMGIDEVGTLNALKAHRRERVDPAIARHNGRIVKTTGDGLLVEFASVVDAVGCAVAIQRAISTTPRHRGLLLRRSRLRPSLRPGGGAQAPAECAIRAILAPAAPTRAGRQCPSR